MIRYYLVASAVLLPLSSFARDSIEDELIKRTYRCELTVAGTFQSNLELKFSRWHRREAGDLLQADFRGAFPDGHESGAKVVGQPGAQAQIDLLDFEKKSFELAFGDAVSITLLHQGKPRHLQGRLRFEDGFEQATGALTYKVGTKSAKVRVKGTISCTRSAIQAD